MATETQENPFSFALIDEAGTEAVEGIDQGLIDEIITALKESNDFTTQEYGYSLDAIKNSLNDDNRALVNRVLLRLQGEENPSRIQDLIVEMQNIVQGRITEVDRVTRTTRNQEQAEIESRFEGIFGAERWQDFVKTWNIERTEDYDALDKILDLFGEGALAFLDVAVDLAGIVLLEGGMFSLGKIWDGISYIVENDYHFFVYLSEKENHALLYLWAYIHVNGGLIAYRYMKDYLTTHYGEAINNRFPATTTTRTVTGKDGSTTTENIEKRHFVQRVLGQGYLDAASPTTSIFNLTDGASENLSAEQNEYLKRRHTMDILKSYYFDNPRLYRRLSRIENNYMQSNTKTFWRSTYRLMEEHGLVRRITAGTLTPELLKREMEGFVISKQQELQRNYYKAIGLLYETSESATGVDIDKNKETDFLKGLRFDIESDPSLTPGEKTSRISALNTFLNRITGDTIISEEKLYAELFRIRDGHATKIRMLEKIQSELDEIRKGNLIRRTGGAISDLLLRRRSNLRRFQQQISDGKWNGSYSEFENHLKDIKSSTVIHRISDSPAIERNNERFKMEMEARMGDVEENEKLYRNTATDNLRNGIHYIVPDNELEKSMDKIFDEFMEAKTPYTEVEFFRELERIGNGFLPSNILLRRLEKAKGELVRQRPTVSDSNRGILDNIRRLRVTTIDIPGIPPTQREGTRNLLRQASDEVMNGNFRNAATMLGSIPNDINILLGDVYNDTLRSLNIAMSARPILEPIVENNRTNTELERQISNVEAFMDKAREGSIDIKSSDIAGIKDGTTVFDTNANYISDEFTEADRDRYKTDLKAYEGIDQFDFKAGLSGDTSGVQGIEAALRDKFRNEINNLKILAEIHGTPNTFSGQLNSLAKSLHENNYTRGQIAPIIERLVAGEQFVDIDIANIVETTTDHANGFSGGQDIKDNLHRSFADLDTQQQRNIIDFIKSNSIPEDELPENIKRGIDRFSNGTEIDAHVSNLNRISAELETAQSIDDIRDIKTRFDRIIDNNAIINPEDDEFKVIIESFNERFRELRAQFIEGANTERTHPQDTPDRVVPTEEPRDTITDTVVESRETLTYNQAKNFLDEIYVSVAMLGDDTEITKLNQEYTRINNDSAYVQFLGEQENLLDYYKSTIFGGKDIFRIRDVNTNLEGLRQRLAEIDNRLARPRTFSAMGDMIRGTHDISIRNSIFDAIKEFRLTR